MSCPYCQDPLCESRAQATCDRSMLSEMKRRKAAGTWNPGRPGYPKGKTREISSIPRGAKKKTCVVCAGSGAQGNCHICKGKGWDYVLPL